MSIREIRLKMESAGNTLQKMHAVFRNENIVDEWNRRKIIPLALEYHVSLQDGQTAIIEGMEDGYRVTIGSVVVDCNYIRALHYDRLVLLGYDNISHAVLMVRTRNRD